MSFRLMIVIKKIHIYNKYSGACLRKKTEEKPVYMWGCLRKQSEV